MNTNKAVRAAFSRGAKATKKHFKTIAAERKSDNGKTKRELLLEIHKKLDKAIEQSKKIGGSV